MSAKSNGKKFTNCIISENGIVLDGEQYERKEYYELIFKDVLDITRKSSRVQLDLTMMETKKREIYLLNTPASIRRSLRKRFGDGVTERVIRGKGSSGLCRLLGFS